MNISFASKVVLAGHKKEGAVNGDIDLITLNRLALTSRLSPAFTIYFRKLLTCQLIC